MNKIINTLSLMTFLVFSISCEKDSVSSDTEAPTVTITFPITNTYVSEIVSIHCVALDNDHIKKVDLWINGVEYGSTDNSEPYSMDWDTTEYEDGSSHTITVRAIDDTGNQTDSAPIVLNIDQTESYPDPVSIFEIPYDYINDTFEIQWTHSEADDFGSYQLYESQSPEMGDMSNIYSTNNINETSYIVTNISEGEIKYYQVETVDTYSLSSTSNIAKGNSHIRYQKTFGGDFNEGASSFVRTDDGGVLIVGTTYSFGSGENDIIAIKVDYYGNEEWMQTYGGENYDYGQDVAKTNDGGYIIVGNSHSYNGGGASDILLLKINSNGDQEWLQTYGGESTDEANGVIQTSDGGYLAVGYTNVGHYELYVLKTDSIGNEEWTFVYGSEGYDWGYDCLQLNDGNFFITGFKDNSFGNAYGVWELILDGNGEMVNEEIFGGGENDYGYESIQRGDGSIIIVGMSYSYGDDDEDILLLCVDIEGNTLWFNVYGGIGGYNGHKGNYVEETFDGGLLLVGDSFSDEVDDLNLIMIKTDPHGTVEWTKALGGEEHDYGKSVIQTEDGGYFILGTTCSFGNGSCDIWLIKTDDSGNID